MGVIDLKQGNLEEKIAGLANREQILAEIGYFDEYYLAPGERLIKIFRQEFNKDPHMDLPKMPEIRLVQYDAGTTANDLEEAFQKSDVPIITRLEERIELPGFRPIRSPGGEESVLMNVIVPIPVLAINTHAEQVRPMQEKHIPKIINLFKEEYSLRYRMVEVMWNEFPEACFVYQEEGEIIGVSFNKIQGDELYMRQIFVRESCRGKKVGSKLYSARLEYARQKGLKIAIAHIRGETWGFHHIKFSAEMEQTVEKYVIRGC